MKKKIWYTYLIGWKEQDIWYYGYRGALDPESDLWVKYFTSSKCVSGIRERFGNPDIVRIHKRFDDRESALSFENRFLRRVKAVSSNRWLNQHDCGDKWVTKIGKIPSQIARSRVSASLVGKTWWNNGEIQTKSSSCPGDKWKPGRLKGLISAEGKQRISKSIASKKWWYNLETTERTRSIDSPGDQWINRKGPDSDVTRMKKSHSRIGLKHSEETKMKMSQTALSKKLIR